MPIVAGKFVVPGRHVWKVPKADPKIFGSFDVTSIHVQLIGAASPWWPILGTDEFGGAGAQSVYARDIPVTPGETIVFHVGGAPRFGPANPFDPALWLYSGGNSFGGTTSVLAEGIDLRGSTLGSSPGGYNGGGDGYRVSACIGPVVPGTDIAPVDECGVVVPWPTGGVTNPITGQIVTSGFVTISGAGAGGTDMRRGGEALDHRVMVAGGGGGGPALFEKLPEYPHGASDPGPNDGGFFISTGPGPTDLLFLPSRWSPDAYDGHLLSGPPDTGAAPATPVSYLGADLYGVGPKSAGNRYQAIVAVPLSSPGDSSGKGGAGGAKRNVFTTQTGPASTPSTSFVHGHEAPLVIGRAGGGGYVGGSSGEILLGVAPEQNPDLGVRPNFVGQDYVLATPGQPGGNFSAYGAFDINYQSAENLAGHIHPPLETYQTLFANHPIERNPGPDRPTDPELLAIPAAYPMFYDGAVIITYEAPEAGGPGGWNIGNIGDNRRVF